MYTCIYIQNLVHGMNPWNPPESWSIEDTIPSPREEHSGSTTCGGCYQDQALDVQQEAGFAGVLIEHVCGTNDA